MAPTRRCFFGGSATIGCVGVPSLIQPYSFAWSTQSGQTSTQFSLPGAVTKRATRSPRRSVRLQTAQVRNVS
jgi:hypothetical protein